MELFLLNKEFNTAATRIFFSKNHFIILPNRGYTIPGYYSYHYLHHQPTPSYSCFFEHIPRSAFEHLRSLQFVIPMNGKMQSEEENFHSVTSNSNPGLPSHWLHSISEILRQSNSTNLTLILDFSTLDHRPRREDLILDSLSGWDTKFSLFANSIRQAMGNDKILRAFFIYPPEHIRLLGLEDKFETLVIGDENHNDLNRKYLHRNRFEYWYTFVTGWVIKDSLMVDIICS